MPTTRKRHLVTETDELAGALDAAARRWPGLSRPQLLVRLALEGGEVERQAAAARRESRLMAIQRHGGALTGVYGAQYLERMRAEWSE